MVGFYGWVMVFFYLNLYLEMACDSLSFWSSQVLPVLSPQGAAYGAEQ
ncbi:MAG: hypothetical protein PWP04_921 [Candidatus Atribacteria bacterium]|nr:hypothetical protein [Candidatus Atribacteria bacterium]